MKELIIGIFVALYALLPFLQLTSNIVSIIQVDIMMKDNASGYGLGWFSDQFKIPEPVKLVPTFLIIDCPPVWIPYPTEAATDCFYFGVSETSLTVMESKAKCKEQNQTLISIHNMDENDFIAAHMNSSHLQLNGRLLHKTWVWLDRTAFNYKNWGEGGGVTGEGDCIIMEDGGAWRPGYCTETASQYACRIGTDPLAAMTTTTSTTTTTTTSTTTTTNEPTEPPTDPPTEPPTDPTTDPPTEPTTTEARTTTAAITTTSTAASTTTPTPAPTTTTPDPDCDALCAAQPNGSLSNGCCTEQYCQCSSGAGYPLDCNTDTLFCVSAQDCVASALCRSDDTCCDGTTPQPTIQHNYFS